MIDMPVHAGARVEPIRKTPWRTNRGGGAVEPNRRLLAGELMERGLTPWEDGAPCGNGRPPVPSARKALEEP